MLRCCGQDNGVELFMALQYLTVHFDFNPTVDPNSKNSKLFGQRTPLSPAERPANPDNAMRDCLLAVAKRWNGEDDVHKDKVFFHLGQPEIARGRLLVHMARGAQTGNNDAVVKIAIFKDNPTFRGLMQGATGEWSLSELQPVTSPASQNGRYVAAHETGHILSLPDEYFNTDSEPSLGQPHITEASRSPGTPYGFDDLAMMNTERKVRTRNFWHLLLWLHEDHFKDVTKASIVHGPNTLSPKVTDRDKSRIQFPAETTLNAVVPPGGSGLCDRFLYHTGQDGWTAGDLDNSASSSPYDGFVVVRVKMAFTFRTTTDFRTMSALLSRANAVIQRVFNTDRLLAVRGTNDDGANVRLRVLFSPRFVCKTAPTGDGSAKYFTSLDPAPSATNTFAQIAQKSIDTHSIHAEIDIVKDGTGGITSVSTPRKGTVRLDGTTLLVFNDPKFDDDIARVFSQLVGLKDENVKGPNDFLPLLLGLGLLQNPRPEFAS